MLSRLSERDFLRKMAFAVGALLLIGIVVYAWPSKAQKTATVYFPRTVHIYSGSDVDVLGIKIGSTTAVKPEGDRVRVDIKYNASQRIPVNASAVIITPTLVADRVVQLTPAYTGGAVMADKAVIPLQRTGVPQELDQVFANLNDLAKDVGPNGANSKGALSNLFSVAADNLNGNGDSIHTTINSIADLAGTLDDNKSALFQTVNNLNAFTATLAQNDQDTRNFMDMLSKVSTELNGNKTILAQALSNLNSALGEVSTFIATNKANLTSNVASLSRVTNVLVKDKDLLGKLIDVGAVGATNYTHVYDPASQSFDGRFASTDLTETPALFICSTLNAVNVNGTQCLNLLKSLGLGNIKLSADTLKQLSSSKPVDPTKSLAGLLGVGK
jgi:phospholipid/cholesterol/gamma-HCH transport system substrate-binding protein